jgi:hypothetical protein
MPPEYPVIDPSAPITRWHGTRIGTGFRPLAAPTALAPPPPPPPPPKTPELFGVPPGLRPRPAPPPAAPNRRS